MVCDGIELVWKDLYLFERLLRLCFQVVEGGGSHLEKRHGNVVEHNHVHFVVFVCVCFWHRRATELEVDRELPSRWSHLCMFGLVVAGSIVSNRGRTGR